MLNKRIPLYLALILSLAIPLSCCKVKKPEPVAVKPVTVGQDNFNYTGSDYKGNYVWGGAMNLAWTELADNIVKDTIQLVTNDKAALQMLDKLNHPVMTVQDIDAESYYVKSGFGPQTQDIINRESRKKFPGKSFDDLNYNLGETDIISYAYFLKQVEYLTRFKKQDVPFLRKMVQGFAADEESYQNVYILKYENEDKFLVGIKLKDMKDQIFLAKGYPMESPEEVIKMLREKVPVQNSNEYNLGLPMREGDIFQAPFLSLNHERDYVEMLGKVLKNRIEGREYFIDVMKEKIRFDMDEKGARVENEGVIVMRETSAGPGNDKIRTMILDKPYWVVMKRYDSNNPYFILGVNNTELMQQAE
jgi:hypothetical protein